jgi:signal transduction histidine kinase
MRRTVENLIENAFRYGGLPVAIECWQIGDVVRVGVMDRGPGIDAEEREAVKNPFVRGRSSVGTPGRTEAGSCRTRGMRASGDV